MIKSRRIFSHFPLLVKVAWLRHEGWLATCCSSALSSISCLRRSRLHLAAMPWHRGTRVQFVRSDNSATRASGKVFDRMQVALGSLPTIPPWCIKWHQGPSLVIKCHWGLHHQRVYQECTKCTMYLPKVHHVRTNVCIKWNATFWSSATWLSSSCAKSPPASKKASGRGGYLPRQIVTACLQPEYRKQ